MTHEEMSHLLRDALTDVQRLREAGDAVLHHLEKNAKDPLSNPAYYRMLADRLRDAGFVSKGRAET